MTDKDYYAKRTFLVNEYINARKVVPDTREGVETSMVLDAISAIEDESVRKNVFDDYIYRIKKIGMPIDSSESYMCYVARALEIEYPERLVLLSDEHDPRINAITTGCYASMALQRGRINSNNEFLAFLDIDVRTDVVAWMDNLVEGMGAVFCKYEAASMISHIYPIEERQLERAFKHICVGQLSDRQLAQLISNIFYTGDPLSRDNIAEMNRISPLFEEHTSWGTLKHYIQSLTDLCQFDLGTKYVVLEAIQVANTHENSYTIPDFSIDS